MMSVPGSALTVVPVSATQTDGVLRFDGTGSTNGITDGSAKVIVGGTVYNVAGGEWVDFSGTSHSLDSWEKVVNSQFDTTITGVSPDPVAPGNTLDVTADITNNGTDSDTQTVTLDIDNGVGQVDSTSVTLSGGGSVTRTLSWSVPSGQTQQNYTATVSSADDSASQTVTVGPVYPSAAIHAYDATQISGVSGGGTVSTWTDQVGSADGSALGSPTYRASQINGKASIELDGSNDAFATGYFPDTANNLTAIAVGEMTAGTRGAVHGQLNSNVENRGPTVKIRDNSFNDYNPAYGDGATTGGTNTAGNPVLLTLEGDGGTATFRQNGSQLFTFSYTGGQTPQDGEMHLGARDRPDQGSVDNFFDGYLAEIVFYDGLSSTERDNEESRLASKWGITI